MILESLGVLHPPEEAYVLKDGKANKIYPSVICGPIDIRRAQEKLGFTPLSLVSDCLALTNPKIVPSHSRNRRLLHAYSLCLQWGHFTAILARMEGDAESPEA